MTLCYTSEDGRSRSLQPTLPRGALRSSSLSVQCYSQTIREFCTKNDYDLIAKLLLCCRDRSSSRSEYVNKKELGC